jgi:site-specific DNA-methyltransferase (adenine-specific)
MIELHHGNCLEVMLTLEPHSVDMILADPPYGITALKHWDSVIPFEPLWTQLKRVIKPNGVIAMFGSQPFTSALVMSNPAWFKHEWIWIKDRGSNFGNTVREPMKEHEQVLIFSAGQWTYNKQMQRRLPSGASRVRYDFINEKPAGVYGAFTREGRRTGEPLRVPASWQQFNRETGLHPTQKPVALLAYLIRTYTHKGETVLDFCMGSGSTGAACIEEGRDFIGIEKDAEYFKVASERLEREQTKPRTLRMEMTV